MADKTDTTKEVSEIKASARGVRISPRKVRLVVDLIRGLTVDQALSQLQFSVKKAALPVGKLINSAVANAANDFKLDRDQLFVKTIQVDGGRVAKRYVPRAQGRAFPIRKPTSHINLVLGVKKTLSAGKKKVGAKTSAKAVDKEVTKDKKDGKKS